MRTLSDLSLATGFEVLEHLDQHVTVPVIDGLQAQGDLIVIPFPLVANAVVTQRWTRTSPVPTRGFELLRSAAGGNPHTLVAEPGAPCRWHSPVSDTMRLALGILETDEVAYLIHPEHGATGIAPGRYVIRRQRERGGVTRFVLD